MRSTGCGRPANYWVGLMTAELWAGLATTTDPAQDLPREKLPVLGAAVLAACDAGPVQTGSTP